MTKKIDRPNGVFISPELREVISRLRDVEPELQEIVRREIKGGNKTEGEGEGNDGHDDDGNGQAI